MATRRTDFIGERYGDWFVESKAPAREGKRYWHVVNTVSDERRLVPQTELKNLENELPSSAEITARVVIGNLKDDPFSIPDGILPDDDSEYPFEIEFVDPFESANAFFDDECRNPDCDCDPDQMSIDNLVAIECEAAEVTRNEPCPPGGVRRSDINPWAEVTTLDAATANALVLQAVDELAKLLREYMNEAIDNWQTAIIRTASSPA